MKVYLCWDGYEDIEHIYDSQEKAEAWLEERNKKAREEGMSQAHFCNWEEREVE